jgi:hypothetical protein
MRQLTLTQEFGTNNKNDKDEENDDPTLPLGWREVVDKFSVKTYFIQDATGNVVFSRTGIFKKPPPDSVHPEPTFSTFSVVSPPPSSRKKTRKPVLINLMASSTEEEEETEDEDERKPHRPDVSTEGLMSIVLPGDSQQHEDSDEENEEEDDEGNESPVLF